MAYSMVEEDGGAGADPCSKSIGVYRMISGTVIVGCWG